MTADVDLALGGQVACHAPAKPFSEVTGEAWLVAPATGSLLFNHSRGELEESDVIGLELRDQLPI